MGCGRGLSPHTLCVQSQDELSAHGRLCPRGSATWAAIVPSSRWSQAIFLGGPVPCSLRQEAFPVHLEDRGLSPPLTTAKMMIATHPLDGLRILPLDTQSGTELSTIIIPVSQMGTLRLRGLPVLIQQVLRGYQVCAGVGDQLVYGPRPLQASAPRWWSGGEQGIGQAKPRGRGRNPGNLSCHARDKGAFISRLFPTPRNSIQACRQAGYLLRCCTIAPRNI